MKKDLFLPKIMDKINLAKKRNYSFCSEFLNLNEQLELERNKFNIFLSGGYENSERKIIIFNDENIEKFLKIIRIELPKGVVLEHKNYLGGIMKLGIKREKIGDILVRSNGADIIVLEDVADFLEINLKELTRFKNAKIMVKNIDELILVEKEKNIFNITVSSMRLDSIVAELYKTSREKAKKIISSERVLVDFETKIDYDYNVKINSLITIRGKGRFKINSVVKTTKNGKIVIEVEN